MTKVQEELLEEVILTKEAAERLIQIRTDKDGDYLRASVTSGGCSGMNYNLGWDKKLGEFDKIYEHHGVKLAIDLKSLLYLRGMTIDFSTDLLSGGFQFVNPNASRTCGCGTSFSV
ncbi:MAG: iron-sulfur cluster assembly accessory protein [Candidatus Neomarinimicrobiota bacterium]|nr:iron-sulfur cluster assembly accessory protein [Candidatus Neomarinimicrobiota bacterium]